MSILSRKHFESWKLCLSPRFWLFCLDRNGASTSSWWMAGEQRQIYLENESFQRRWSEKWRSRVLSLLWTDHLSPRQPKTNRPCWRPFVDSPSMTYTAASAISASSKPPPLDLIRSQVPPDAAPATMLRGLEIDDGFEVQRGMKIIDEYWRICANLCDFGKNSRYDRWREMRLNRCMGSYWLIYIHDILIQYTI